jgi:hypothetical protein
VDVGGEHMLTYAGECWRMLTYAGVCWRMMPDVCCLTYTAWRMLPDVWWRMLSADARAAAWRAARIQPLENEFCWGQVRK